MNYFKWLSYIIISLSIVLCGYIIILLSTPTDFFQVKVPMTIKEKEHKQGETLNYTINYCKTKNYEVAKFERSLVGTYIYKLPDINTKGIILPIGCGELYSPVYIPIISGIDTSKPYRIVVTITYKMNPLKTEIKQFETEEFYLLPTKAK